MGTWEESWKCRYCKVQLPAGEVTCDKCKAEHTITVEEERIELGDITYSRVELGLGPTGIELYRKSSIGRRAIDCRFMSEELQEQIREFVWGAEKARDGRLKGE